LVSEQINGGSTDYNQLEKWAKEVESLTSKIDEKTMRWLELDELMH
jgi:hypothetical protein